MQNNKVYHPTEDQLERFVLGQNQQEELEAVETHILACDSCVTRLEGLELEIRATKLALQEVQSARSANMAAKQRNSRRSWFTVPKLSLTGALATLAIGVLAVPKLVQRSAPMGEVSLSAYRGAESSIVPEGQPLHVRLKAGDLVDGPVTVDVVDSLGTEISMERAAIYHNEMEIILPAIRERGTHFLRLYAVGHANPEGHLLREFAFRVE